MRGESLRSGHSGRMSGTGAGSPAEQGRAGLAGLAATAEESVQESVEHERDALGDAEEDTTPGTGGLVPPDDAQSAPPPS